MDDNYSKLTDIAYKLHTAGKFKEAENIYKKLLTYNSEDVNILYLYGQLNMTLKNYDIAIELFQKVYNKTNFEEAKICIAKIHEAKRDWEKSLQILNSIDNKTKEIKKLTAINYMKINDYIAAYNLYKELVDSKEADSADYYNMSLCCCKSDNYEEALNFALNAYKLKNDDIDIIMNIAAIYEHLSKFKEAIIYFNKAANIVNNPEIFYRIGCLYKKIQEYTNAIEYFYKVLEIDAGHKMAILNIANTYSLFNKAKAIEYLKSYNSIFPEDDDILTSMYFTYLKMMDYKNCLETSKKLMELNPLESSFIVFCADTYNSLYEYEKAEELYKKVLEIEPDNLTANVQLANIYSQKNMTEEAVKIIKPYLYYEDAKKAYAYILMRNKVIDGAKETLYSMLTEVWTKEEGKKNAQKLFYHLGIGDKYGISEEEFTQYEKQMKFTSIVKYKKYLEKAWKNQNIDGKRLLVFSQHGAGDIIMFLRYVNDIKDKVSKIILQVPVSLFELIKYNYPDLVVKSEKDIIDESEYDYAVSFFCLLCTVCKSLKEIKYSSGYLKADDKLVKEKSKLPVMKTDKKKVGIYWQGNPTVFINRSIKLSRLSSLFKLNNIQLYSFQISNVDFESENLKKNLNLIDLKPYINNYADTAAFLKNMDLLITIDTSIANLAGAMGINTYLLLPYYAEWRWFYDTKTTPWYDSIRIFKQNKPDDWEEVIERVINELKL